MDDRKFTHDDLPSYVQELYDRMWKVYAAQPIAENFFFPSFVTVQGMRDRIREDERLRQGSIAAGQIPAPTEEYPSTSPGLP